MSPRTRLLACALLAAVAASGSAFADTRTLALDGAGTAYAVSAGAYGDLFPGGRATAAANPVLALDVTPAGGATARLLVPGSEGPESEVNPFLVLDPATQTLYTVWQRQTASSSTIGLVGLAGGEFGGFLEVTDRASAVKSALQVSITRDAYTRLAADASRSTVERTVLHLLWWEPASQQSYYKPILLVGGTVLAGQPAVTLGDLDGPAVEPTASQVSPALYAAPRTAAGRNDHAAILGFANSRTGRILSIEVSVVPGEMSALADDLRSYIEQTAVIGDAQDLQNIAEAVRGHIISTGARITDSFQPGMLQFLGDAVRGHIISTGVVFDGDATALAEDARRFALRSGVNVIANGLDRPGMAPLQTAAILDVPGAPLATGSQQVEMRITASHPAPATGDGVHTLLLSPDGVATVVAWDAAGAVDYRTWQANAWTTPNTLKLGPTLTHDQALSLLQRSVREY